MELVNATKMQASYTMGVRPDGREVLIVVVKGTFTIPHTDEESPKLADEQVALITTDQFTGEPGFSAPLCEIDFAPRKPMCDVLLNGSAYAPGGESTTRVKVSLRVGDWSKSFDVVGNRVWEPGLLSTNTSRPEPFTIMPISYNNAFGGIDRSRDDEREHRYYPSNHVGLGYHVHPSSESLYGRPLPNTEETGNSVKKPNGRYRPMAFGPVGRGWENRIRYAGTYDKNWLNDVFPFLPGDFSDEYYQAAPREQWIKHPKGGETVELLHLIPQGRTVFNLPKENVHVTFIRKNGNERKYKGVIDTLMFEPDLQRFTMCWRTCLPLQRNLHEIAFAIVRCEVATTSEDDTFPQKQRYSSLAELVSANKKIEEEA